VAEVCGRRQTRPIHTRSSSGFAGASKQIKFHPADLKTRGSTSSSPLRRPSNRRTPRSISWNPDSNLNLPADPCTEEGTLQKATQALRRRSSRSEVRSVLRPAREVQYWLRMRQKRVAGPQGPPLDDAATEPDAN